MDNSKKPGDVVDMFTRKTIVVEDVPKERRGKKKRKQEAALPKGKVSLSVVGEEGRRQTKLHDEPSDFGDSDRDRIHRLLDQIAASVPSDRIDVLRDALGVSSRFDHIMRYLNSLRVVRNAETSRSRRGLVEGYSNDEIVGWLTDSSETEWKTHPEFYYALLEEAERRHLG